MLKNRNSWIFFCKICFLKSGSSGCMTFRLPETCRISRSGILGLAVSDSGILVGFGLNAQIQNPHHRHPSRPSWVRSFVVFLSCLFLAFEPGFLVPLAVILSGWTRIERVYAIWMQCICILHIIQCIWSPPQKKKTLKKEILFTGLSVGKKRGKDW